MTIKYSRGILKLSCTRGTFLVFKFLIPICLIFTTSYYLFRSQIPLSSSISNLPGQIDHLYDVVVSGKKGAFVEQALETEIDGPFNNTSLSALCSKKDWIPGLIFKCDAPQGGVGNVRNVFLNCIRYAIEAGASSLIVPEIISRGSQLTDLTTTTLVPFTYFFDLPFFTSSLSEACPQMAIVQHINDLWQFPTTATQIPLSPQQLTTSFLPEAPMVLAEPEKWNIAFRQWLLEFAPRFSADWPVVIALGTPLLQWPLSYDPPQLVATFGKLLRFREDARKLASVVLYAMNKKHNLDLAPSTPGIAKGKFYGAHLRTAVDASAAGWTPYSIQASNYLAAALDHNLSTIYLTSGNPSDTTQFTSTAAQLNISVTSKVELLSDPEYAAEKAAMENLTWDQQALVDWEVLLRSSLVGGTWESSFAWNIALRRHVVVGGGTWFGRGMDVPVSREGYTPVIADVVPGDGEGIEFGERPREEREERRRNIGMVEERDEAPQAFRDWASIIFGAEGQGNYFHLAMWP